MWMINGNGDDGAWTPEFYRTKKQAQKVFDNYVEERKDLYGVEIEVTEDEDGGYTAEYDNGSNRHEFWYMTKVKTSK